jgi:hypothetical protein
MTWAVPEHDDLVVPDQLGGPGQLLHADVVETGPDVGLVHGRIEDVARFAAGAAHQHGVHAFLVVLVHGAGALRRFIVGVGVHGQETQLLVHQQFEPIAGARLFLREPSTLAIPAAHSQTGERAQD